jgi:hypothetical protein
LLRSSTRIAKISKSAFKNPTFITVILASVGNKRVSPEEVTMDLENKGSETSASEQAAAAKKQEPNQGEPLATQGASTEAVHKGGGPRTQQGKAKSSRNSLKHGIFSKVVEGESRSQYNSLLRGLREDFKPKGAHREVLVDKLAILFLCQRQVLEALVGRSLVDTLAESYGEAPKLDILLRYLTTLDRAIDRVLSQLEGPQRKGQSAIGDK